MITVFGIKNCDTMKKAFAWLAEHGVAHEFHDYKKRGIDTARLQRWASAVGWQALLNTKGTTWRRLAPAQQANLDAASAIALMAEMPSLIRRPVIECGDELLVGFEPRRYAVLLASQ